MENIIRYLTDLQANNNREWFNDNKKRYESCRKEYLSVVGDVIAEIAAFDPRLAGLQAKEALFRIYRDVRFSKDKTPYKTHFGAYMARGGRKSAEAGYYMHVSPDEFFVAGGVHSPAKEPLKVIRQEILYQPGKYMKIRDELLAGGFEQMSRDRLKTAPKDFPQDSPHIDLIRDKHYIFSKTLSDSEMQSDKLTSIIGDYFRNLHPLTVFLNTAMEYTGNE